MKNLAYYKKQVEESKRQKRLAAWADQQIETHLRPILAESQRRTEGLLQDLKLQRCKLESSINLFQQRQDPFGITKAAVLFEREAAYPWL